MTSPMPPEPTAEEWARVEAEYAARERERHALLIETVLDAHHWVGMYHCRCGAAVNPRTSEGWGRHLLWAALEPDE